MGGHFQSCDQLMSICSIVHNEMIHNPNVGIMYMLSVIKTTNEQFDWFYLNSDIHEITALLNRDFSCLLLND